MRTIKRSTTRTMLSTVAVTCLLVIASMPMPCEGFAPQSRPVVTASITRLGMFDWINDAFGDKSKKEQEAKAKAEKVEQEAKEAEEQAARAEEEARARKEEEAAQARKQAEEDAAMVAKAKEEAEARFAKFEAEQKARAEAEAAALKEKQAKEEANAAENAEAKAAEVEAKAEADAAALKEKEAAEAAAKAEAEAAAKAEAEASAKAEAAAEAEAKATAEAEAAAKQASKLEAAAAAEKAAEEEAEAAAVAAKVIAEAEASKESPQQESSEQPSTPDGESFQEYIDNAIHKQSRVKCIVQWYNGGGGFGFIKPFRTEAEGEELVQSLREDRMEKTIDKKATTYSPGIFVHHSAIQAPGDDYFRKLYAMESVECEIGIDDRGRTVAQNVSGPGGGYVKSILKQENDKTKAEQE